MSLDFNDYQILAMKTAIYPSQGANLEYPALGLCSEAAEVIEGLTDGATVPDSAAGICVHSGAVAGIAKKIQRDHGRVLSDEHRERLRKELGDVLWYVAMVCTESGLNLADVAQANLDKLASRQGRGTLQGSGDNR